MMFHKICLMIPFIVIALVEVLKNNGNDKFSWSWFLLDISIYGSACVTICRLIWRVM